MPADLETRLRDAMHATASSVAVPHDLAATVESRVVRRRRQAHLVRVAAAAIVAVALGVTAVLARGGDARDTDPAGTGEGLGRWDPLPEAPIDRRTGAGAVWTGDELVVFGGANSTETDGAAAYDPEDRSWRELADAPDGLGFVTAAWTGREVVALSTNPFDWEAGRPGAVYDPGRDAWRPMAAAGIGVPDSLSVPAWTGDRVVVATTTPAGEIGVSRAVGAAAYDPATDTWSSLPAAPEPVGGPGQAVWTGDELVHVGRTPYTPGVEGTDTFVPGPLVAQALDPDTGTWRTLPSPPVPAAEDTAVAWTGDELVVVGGEADVPAGGPGGTDTVRTGVVALDPASGDWRPLPAVPVPVASLVDRPLPVVAGRVVFLAAEDPRRRPLVLDPDSGTWAYGAPAPAEDLPSWAVAAAGDRLLVWGGVDVRSDVAGEAPAPPAPGPGGYAYTPGG